MAMLSSSTTIKPLPPDVVAKIKSSVAIASLSATVLGLIQNSLDADACTINISVDFKKGACSVEDDGVGIAPGDFAQDGGLCQPYHTSKFRSGESIHGRHGTFLSSLTALSILTITSHHNTYSSTNSLVFHHSKPVARLTPAPSYHDLICEDHGTRATVNDLFGTMPVRVKQRVSVDEDHRVRVREWELLRKSIVGMLLAWKMPVSLSLRGPNNHVYLRVKPPAPPSEDSTLLRDRLVTSKSFDLALIQNTLFQGADVEPSSWKTWIKTSARTPFITIRGVISLQPVPSKYTQFISIGNQHISDESGYNILYEEINRVFMSSSFGVEEDQDKPSRCEEDQIPQDERLKKSRSSRIHSNSHAKGIDRWPMFFIHIEPHARKGDYQSNNQSFQIKENTVSSFTNLLRTMVTGFLVEHHFRPRRRRPIKRNPSKAKATKNLPYGQKTLESCSLPGKIIAQSSLSNQTMARNENIVAEHNQKTVEVPSDLQNHIRFPSFARSLSAKNCFDGWSRIKTGRRDDISNVVQDSQPPTKRGSCEASTHTLSTQGTGLNPKEIFSQRTSSEVEPISIFSSIYASDAEVSGLASPLTDRSLDSSIPYIPEQQVTADPVLIWTNPVSKKRVKVSARTGLLIDQSLEAKYSSCVDPENRLMHSNLVSSSRERQSLINRSASDTVLALKKSNWAKSFLNSWENPTFNQTENDVLQISLDGLGLDASNVLSGRHHHCSNADIDTAFIDISSLFAGTLSKKGLERATIIAQADRKFILVKMSIDSVSRQRDQAPAVGNRCLVLIDQHAADERIRVEGLLAELCTKPSAEISNLRSSLGFSSAIGTNRLIKPFAFQIQAREHSLFQCHALCFARWGILYELPVHSIDHSVQSSRVKYELIVLSLPPAIAERCRLDPKILLQLMRGEVWAKEGAKGTPRSTETVENGGAISSQSSMKSGPDIADHNWRQRIRDCPKGILEMINSRACRSAIMFNDELGQQECKVLIERLARCSFPFQCAHGRPSMIPLVSLETLDEVAYAGRPATCMMDGGESKPEVDFQRAWELWKN